MIVPQIGASGKRHPRSALFGPRGRGAPKSAHTHGGRPEIRVSRRRCAAAPEIGADLARTENDPRSTRLLEGRPEIDAVRSVCAKRLRSAHRRRGAPQINDRWALAVENDPRSTHDPRSTLSISGFTRGDLKPTGISGHAPRSYTDLGRPFRERAGERRFGVAPKDRPKPRRFGVIHAGIRRSGVSRRFGVIHQNLRRSGQNPYINTTVFCR